MVATAHAVLVCSVLFQADEELGLLGTEAFQYVPVSVSSVRMSLNNPPCLEKKAKRHTQFWIPH